METSYDRKWYLRNRLKKIKLSKKYRDSNPSYGHDYHFKNKDKRLSYNKKWRDENKLRVLLNSIKTRCRSKRTENYRTYGKKGIKCFLTENELKIIWKRDGADKLKRPSIDRINPDGHYIFKNCRFIELSENCRRAHKIEGD